MKYHDILDTKETMRSHLGRLKHKKDILHFNNRDIFLMKIRKSITLKTKQCEVCMNNTTVSQLNNR